MIPDHPRVREIEDERKAKPLGVNCHINILRSGARHVVPTHDADPNGPGTRSDKPYFGPVPFRVTRNQGQPDVVTVALLISDASTEDTPVYYEIISNNDATFTTSTPEPLPVDLPMSVAVAVDFSVFFALWNVETPPPIGPATPMYQPLSVTPFYVIEHISTAPTLEELASGYITPPSPLDQSVPLSWSGTITIDADSVDPSGTLPIDEVRVIVYTDNTRSVEIFRMLSGELWP